MKKFITDHIAIFVVAAIAIGIVAFMKVRKLENPDTDKSAGTEDKTE